MGVRSEDHLELSFLKIFTKLNLRRSKDAIVYKAYITSSKIRYIFNGPLIWTMGRFISSLTVRIIYSKNSLFFGELCFSRHNNEESKILSLIQVFFVLTKHDQKNLKKMRLDFCFNKRLFANIKMLDFLWLWSLFSFPTLFTKKHFFRLLVKTKSKALKACLHGDGGPQIGEVTGDGSPHLTCKHDQIKVRDYMNRRVTPPKWVTSPTWGHPRPCKQVLKLFPVVCWNVWQGWALIETWKSSANFFKV